ncbi:MAG: hypothetical protein IT423_05860, partial [Pirellulaceae bacterium]|nr:hypothetical protein [Pirellulaceae bacterium]
ENGVADQVLLALGIEFFLLDQAPPSRRRHGAGRPLDNDRRSDLGFDVERTQRDAYGHRLDDDFRNEVMHALSECSVSVASHRQAEGDRTKSRFELSESSLVTSADHVMITKHVVRRIAARWNKAATFMPLPQAGRLPAGMPTQLALIQSDNCVLSGSDYAGLSEVGLYAIGGILKHAAALTALSNSTTNSYARLGLGLGLGLGMGDYQSSSSTGRVPRIAYSQSDLRAAVRVPTHRSSKHKCLEFQLPDAIGNPYLTFTALLMAAIDGVQNKIQPGPALDPDPYTAGDELPTSYQRVPASLSSALTRLEEDGEFLLRGDVFTAEFLQSWIDHKRQVDIEALRKHPHPHEVAAYFDA